MFALWQIFALVTFALASFISLIYCGYYFYVSKCAKKQVNRNEDDFTTRITVVIPTYNEEATIKKKLENLRKQTYPIDLTEIIVIDSNSKDDTVKITRDFMRSHPELIMKIIREDERRGKSVAINKAFSCASPQSEILLMTDVDALLEENAIKKVISRFVNPEIGAVSGIQVLRNVNESRETKSAATYNYYFGKLRIGESALDSTPFIDGELAAYRASVIREMKLKENLNADDCQLAIMVRRKGYRAIREPEAIFYEYAPPDWSSNQIQKVRRGQGLSRLFWYNRDMLFKKKYGKFGLVILPANFFMHLVSPFLVLLSLVFGPAFFFSLVLEGGNLILLVISIAIISSLLLDNFLFKRKFMYVVWTFLEYQMILLKGILLFLLGKSLHKWQKVESVRMKFRNETDMK
jgi:cellulose synthase/poly-beta-1,6-N-acetylglucosamine synthase-like glycosyltransferase